ncbi:MAG: rod shape-determining protein MreC [Candidatus Hydrogenedentota bacterium]
MLLSFSLPRRLRGQRSTILFIILVVCCLASLASGAQAVVIGDALRTAGSVAAYPFWKGLTAAQNALHSTSAFFVNYEAAKREAEALRYEVTDLTRALTALDELRAENDRLREMLEFARAEPRFTVEPAEVIGRSFEGVLTIDRGGVHGVREAMCVLTQDGVVGMVAKVEPFFSHVYTLHHSQCRVGAMIPRNRVRGIVHGGGSARRPVSTMQYIDIKDDVRPGDEVVTSGGSIFPSGFPVGKVRRVEFDSESLLKTAFIEPVLDPYSLDEVFVLRAAPPSPEELTGEDGGDGGDDSLYALPDNRSIQERYAP